MGKGYITPENDLKNFVKIDALPKLISPRRLNDRCGIASTLTKNLAKCHKICRDHFNSTKLLRLQKRKHDEAHHKAGLDLLESLKCTRSHYQNSNKELQNH